jgi:uridine kinase
LNQTRAPFLVAIVGGSCSGKSRLAERLKREIGSRFVSLIPLDDFYLDRSHLSPRQRARINYDHPRAIEWYLVKRSLNACLSNRPAKIPKYDFSTHYRKKEWRILTPKPLVILEGLWPCRLSTIRALFQLKIFLDCSAHTRLRRRLKRDAHSRGRTRASIAAQFRETVEPMHQKYVTGQRAFADVVLLEKCGSSDVKQLVALLRARLRDATQ